MKKIFLTLLIGLSLASCSDWLDINKDPNKPSNVAPELVLAQAELALASTYGGILHNQASFIVQYFNQRVGAPNFMGYNKFDVQANNGDRQWNNLYNLCMVNAEYVRTETAKKQDWGTYLAATVVKVFAAQCIVDNFGEAPYSQALQGGANAQPAYDQGADIYAAILTELDTALSKVGISKVTSKNMLYGKAEDATEKWVKFGNALKLRLLMRQAAKDWDGVKARVNALIAENNFPTADVTYDVWQDEGTKRNPWYLDAAVFFGKADHMGAMSYVNTLASYNDPRLNARFDLPSQPTNTTLQKGGVPGIEYVTTSDPKENFSTPKYDAVAPVYMITLAEIEFFKAEAAVRNTGVAAAKDAYEAAVTASFAQAGVTGASALLSGAYAWNTTQTVPQALAQIALQKWIALGCVNGFESWCEVRRLGAPGFCTESAEAIKADGSKYEYGKLIYPKGAPEILSNTKSMLNRYYYPTASVALNPSAPSQKTPLTKIFWQN